MSEKPHIVKSYEEQLQLLKDTIIIPITYSVALKGQIIDNLSKEPLVGANIFNLNSVIGSVSDDDGKFEIETRANDTLYISYVGFKHWRVIYTI